MSAFARRLAWHLRLAARATRATVVIAGLGGVALPFLLPVTEAWLVGAVAMLAALLAVGIMATPSHQPPPDLADVDAALEGVETRNRVAHSLLRAAFVLGALALGLALGGLLSG
jgi:uncharacterized membrane protein